MKKIISVLLIIFLLVGCQGNKEVIADYEVTIDKLSEDINAQVKTNKELEGKLAETKKAFEEVEIVTAEQEIVVEELKSQIEELENTELQIPDMSNWKYQEASGLRRYIGETGLRLYPSEDAPLVYGSDGFSHGNDILFCRAVVTVANSESSGHVGKAWGIVIVNAYGQTKVGYVPYSELEVIEKEEIEVVESIGSFSLGDRIEKMIGVLDQDYEIKSENLCMYFFYDEPNQGVEPIFMVGPTIEAFVSEDFRIYYLRTDSPKYELESGYRVGDKALEVLDYYREHYTEEESDFYFPSGQYTFRLSETEFIGFSIGADDLSEDSLITWIGLY